jgi:hypothetical protein
MNSIDKLSRFSVTLAALASVGALAGCEDNDFDPGSRVTGLRVLAQQVDNPYARPGEAIHLTSLSHEPAGRAVTWAWAACVNPDSSSVEGCLEKVARDSESGGASPVLAMGQGLQSFDYTVPASALDGFDEDALPLAQVGLLSVACPGELSLNGSHELPFGCTEAGSGRELGLDEFVVGIKRVYVRNADRNQNPAVAQILFDGAEWPADLVPEVDACETDDNQFDDCSKSLSHRLAAVPTPSSFEAGRDEFGREFEEQLVVQYYSTEGIFEDEVRVGDDPETRFVARNHASGQELGLWFVIRDDRGGVTWTERRLRVR